MSILATAAPASSAMSPELDGSLGPLQALTLIVETVRVLLWSMAPDGVLRYVNQRVVDYTGRTLKDLVERGWEDLIHPDDRDNVVGAWSHAVRTGGSYQVRHRLRRTDGEYRWFLVQAAPLLDSQGRVIQFSGMNTELAFPPSDYEAEAAPRSERREVDAIKPSGVSLSARERTIVLMMGHGLSNKRIARQLSIAPETVKSHAKRIFDKLAAQTRAQAVYRASTLGIIVRPSPQGLESS